MIDRFILRERTGGHGLSHPIIWLVTYIQGKRQADRFRLPYVPVVITCIIINILIVHI